MEKVSEFFLKRPLFVNILIIFILFAGIKTAIDMQKEGFPAVSENKIIITSLYPGASSEDVELNVTDLIESELSDVANIKEVLSTSKEGVSQIIVVADDNLSERQFSKFYNDVGNTIGAISDLPANIQGPSYKQATSDEMPIIEIAVGGESKDLTKFVSFVVFELKKINGISKVEKVGFPDEEVHVVVDPLKANNNYIDLRQVYNSIASRNVEGSGGTIESYIGEEKVVIYDKFKNFEHLLNTNIRRSVEGKGVRLLDIARVQPDFENLKLLVRNDGRAGGSLIIMKKSNADLLDTIKKIRKVVGKIKTPSNIHINLLNDKSVLTRDRLKLLGSNAVIGILLVFIILWFALGLKSAIWTSFSIPLSFLGMIIFLPYLGITINAITLGGCVLVLGMLVDDAIVVVEQINREKERNIFGIQAAINAVKKVWAPILGSSLTTMIAYWPLSKLGGLPGKFVWVIPVVVIMALFASLFDTYFLLPTHVCHGSAIKDKRKKFIELLEGYYSRLLEVCFKLRYAVLLFFIVLLISAMFIAKNFLEKEPFPQDAAEAFTIQVTLDAKVNFEQASDQIKVIEEEILKLPKEELAGVSIRIGTHSKAADLTRGSSANLAMIFVYLKPFSLRVRTALQIISALREKLKKPLKLAGINAVFELLRIGPPLGRAFEVRVSSSLDTSRLSTVQAIKQFISTLPGVTTIDDDYIRGKKELNINLDHDRIAELGITVSDVLQTIKIAFDGLIVSDMVVDNKSIDIRVKQDQQGKVSKQYLEDLSIMNKNGRLVKLSGFTKLVEKDSNAEIYHLDGRRTTTVYGQIDKDKTTGQNITNLVQKKFISSKDVQITYSGEPVENSKIFKNLRVAAVIAVVGVFLILALILNSLARPLIVMSAVPFGIIGIVYSIFVHGMPLSMFVIISMIGLSGIIVNDSIVMVYTIADLIKSGPQSIENIIRGATARLRPVMLTTVTTVLGLLPTAYGVGGSDPFISPMCLAMAYGLLFGTVIVLILVPIIYMIGTDLKKAKA
ncbi:MAG: efflux RND transporter permease subunit [Bacteriovoracaceae bacterium]|nr:efflux RND transporter permease subunit [Bacteriovoracaceae bacterium]